MSRPNSVARSGSESILQKKKTWLRDKVEEIRTSYADTLGAIKEKLDGIVTEPMTIANNLLSRPDNVLSLHDIATAGNMLQESNKSLWEILLALCPSGDNVHSQTGNQHVNMAMQLVPLVSHQMVRQQRDAQIVAVSAPQSLGVDYMQLDAATVTSGLMQRAGLRYSSESESGAFEPLPLPLVDTNNNFGDIGKVESLPPQDVPVIPAPPDLDISLSSITHPTNSTPRRLEHNEEEGSKETLKNVATPEASTSEPSSSKQVYHSFSSDEMDPNAFRAIISDIVSPDRFSIQPEENLPRIRKLQKELNQFYEEQRGDLEKLELKTIPDQGDACAVIFQPDKNWYRARVLSPTSQSTILVEYIDYGNVDEIPWRRAFKLHSLFTDLTQQAIHCCLAGIKPAVPRYGAADGEVEWDTRAVEWFDKFVYGRTYEVVPVQASDELMSVKLLYVEDSEDGSVIRSVADMLVQSGLAVFVDEEEIPESVKLCEKTLEEIKKQNDAGFASEPAFSGVRETNDNNEPLKSIAVNEHQRQFEAGQSVHTIAVPNLSQVKEMPSPCEIACRHNSVTRSVSCIPAGMERTNHRLQTPSKSRTSTPETKLYVPRKQVSPSTGIGNAITSDHLITNKMTTGRSEAGDNKCHPIEQGSHGSPAPRNAIKVDNKAADEEKRLAVWDPMADDYHSARNCYGIDDENACVVTEGYNPEKMTVCRHYVHGRCWSGNRCPNVHPQRLQNGELKTEVATFSASSLKTLELKEGSWSIVRLTVVTSTGNFYVHVVKAASDMQECAKVSGKLARLPEISPDLANLMSDMNEHYSQSSRKIKDLIKPAPGEMYAVHVPEEKSFYRAMILDVSLSQIQYGGVQTVKVHLVDFGRDVVVPERYLHPMCPAFMHLPKQAVMCSLWDGKLCDYPKLEHLANSRSVSHVAMKVQSRNDQTDGPLNITLYKMDKDGLHPVPAH